MMYLESPTRITLYKGAVCRQTMMQLHWVRGCLHDPKWSNLRFKYGTIKATKINQVFESAKNVPVAADNLLLLQVQGESVALRSNKPIF